MSNPVSAEASALKRVQSHSKRGSGLAQAVKDRASKPVGISCRLMRFARPRHAVKERLVRFRS